MYDNLGTLDVELYLQHYGIKYGVKQDGAVTRYILEECLFDHNHRGGEAAICASPNAPFLTYHCYHNSCKGYRWQDARAVISGKEKIVQFYAGYDPDHFEKQRKKKTETKPETAVCKFLSGVSWKHEYSFSRDDDSPLPPPEKVDPELFFRVSGKRESWTPMVMGEYLAVWLGPVKHTMGTFWRYADGVWTALPRSSIRQCIGLALKHRFRKNHLDSSIDALAALVNREEELWPVQTKYINCKSGMLDIETKEMKDHHPDYGSRCQIPCSFDWKYLDEAGRFNRYLDEVFPEKESVKRSILCQFAGYCLINSCRYEKMLFLRGEGANGKSKFIDAMIAMVGEDNVANLPIDYLGKRFMNQVLQEKMINLATETMSNEPIQTETLKAAVSGDYIQAEGKYGDPFKFRPHAKFIFSINRDPIIPDKSHGWERRIIIVNFNQKFDGKNRDTRLREKLQNEKDGVFMWSLLGLQELQEQDGFELEKDVLSDTEEFYKSLNPFMLWVEEKCDLGDGDWVYATDLFDNYKDWCKSSELRKLGRPNFYGMVKALPGVVKLRAIGEKRRPGFTGITLKSDII